MLVAGVSVKGHLSKNCVLCWSWQVSCPEGLEDALCGNDFALFGCTSCTLSLMEVLPERIKKLFQVLTLCDHPQVFCKR